MNDPEQQDLFDQPIQVRFNGADYVPKRDDVRLTGQIARVFLLMKDCQWRTLAEIAGTTDDPPASVSAQLRHLRKKRFGSHTVNRVYMGGGLYRYQVIPNPETTSKLLRTLQP